MIDLVDRLNQDALQRQNGLGRPDGPAIEEQAADEIESLRDAVLHLEECNERVSEQRLQLLDLVHLCSGFLDSKSPDAHVRAAVQRVIREMRKVKHD